MNIKDVGDWPAVILILGLVLGCIGFGSYLVTNHHDFGYILIVLPVLAIFL